MDLGRLILSAYIKISVIHSSPLAHCPEANRKPGITTELFFQNAKKFPKVWIVLPIEVDTNVDPESIGQVFERLKILKDFDERPPTISSRTTTVVVFRRSVKGNLK